MGNPQSPSQEEGIQRSSSNIQQSFCFPGSEFRTSRLLDYVRYFAPRNRLQIERLSPRSCETSAGTSSCPDSCGYGSSHFRMVKKQIQRAIKFEGLMNDKGINMHKPHITFVIFFVSFIHLCIGPWPRQMDRRDSWWKPRSSHRSAGWNGRGDVANWYPVGRTTEKKESNHDDTSICVGWIKKQVDGQAIGLAPLQNS